MGIPAGHTAVTMNVPDELYHELKLMAEEDRRPLGPKIVLILEPIAVEHRKERLAEARAHKSA